MEVKRGYYSPSEVRTILGCRQKTVYELLESRQIPSFKIGNRWRIPADMFYELMENAATEGLEITETRRETVSNEME